MCITVGKGFGKRSTARWNETLRKLLEDKRGALMEKLNLPEKSDDWRPKNVEYKVLRRKANAN